jgi:succinate dehydrogenase / fumarate reductase cytochrome b subunit
MAIDAREPRMNATQEMGMWRRMLSVFSYRGREGQWSWLVHRVAGLGILSFLFLHIFDIWLMGLGEDVFNDFLFLYSAPPFKVLEVFLIFGVLFHAVNGARIIVIDFVPGATRYHRQLVWVEAAIMAVVMVPLTWLTLGSLLTSQP